jgi:hypothetical protein
MSRAEALLRLAQRAKAENHPFVRDSIVASLIDDDEQADAELAGALYMAALHHELDGHPFEFPTAGQILAEAHGRECIIIAKSPDIDCVFVYPVDALAQNALIVGAPGTGKTSVERAIAAQVMRHGRSVWAIDREKRDFRGLIAGNPDFIVFDETSFVFNPLQSHAPIRRQHQAEAFISIFCKENAVLDLGESLLRTVVFSLLQEKANPTFFDVRNAVANLPGHHSSAVGRSRDSLTAKMDAYLIANEQLYGASEGFPIAELAERSFVLEVKGLSESHARFLTNMLLYTLYLWRLARNERGNVLRTLVIIDEAKWLAPPGYNHHTGFSPIAHLLSQGRETGIGLLIADQTAHLDAAVFANTRLKLCFRLGDGVDIERVRKSMGLSEEQAAFISRLGTGEAAARIPQVKPFLIRIPKIRIAS